MGKNIILLIIVTVLLLVIDIFARFLYAESWLSHVILSKEINLIEIIGIIVSACVAIWLGLYITKKLSAQRFQKEYLISDLIKIEEEIWDIENQINGTPIELQHLLNLLYRFKLYIDRFSKTVEIFQITCISSNKLSDFYFQLYTLTTDLDGNLFIADENCQFKINTICTSIIAETRQMIFNLNKN